VRVLGLGLGAVLLGILPPCVFLSFNCCVVSQFVIWNNASAAVGSSFVVLYNDASITL
jgi:hypothetical protein